MNRGRGRSGGYTIVETMIFLAVTGMMFASAMIFVSGQQQKTEFNQSVRNFTADLQSLINDVSTGYTSFPFQSGQYCWTNGSSVTIAPSAAGQEHCIMVGRLLQFAPGGQKDSYELFLVVGKQHDTSKKEVVDLQGARPLALSAAVSGTAYAEQTKKVGYGTTIAWVKYGNSPGNYTNSMGLFTTFASYDSTGIINSNSTRANMIPLPISQTNCTAASKLCMNYDTATTVNKMDLYTAGLNAAATSAVANQPLMICLDSAGTNQHAEVSLGNNTGSNIANGILQVVTVIKQGMCP